MSVRQTTDSGYFIAGFTQFLPYGVYLIKTNSLGDTLWTRTYGGSTGYSVQQTSDGGYIITGWSMASVYLIKTNSSGDTLWTRTYGFYPLSYSNSVQQTSDGGYIIAGTSYWNVGGEGPGYDVYLIKTNSLGDTLWTRTYGTNSDEGGSSIQQTSDGGYIIVGTGFNDVYLIKTDSLGETLWTKTYGCAAGDEGNSVQQTSDDGYIITGTTNMECPGWPTYRCFGADVYLVKTNSFGDTLWTRTYGGQCENHGCQDYGYSVQHTTDGGYVIVGATSSFGAGNTDVYLIKTDGNGLITDVSDSNQKGIPSELVLEQNYPNPFNPSTTISYQLPTQSHVTLKIFDVLGREVAILANTLEPPGFKSVNFNSNGLSSGVYYYRLQAGNYVETRKLLLLR